MLDAYPNNTTRLSLAFDRVWERHIMKHTAAERIELLRLRLQDAVPIRTIAERCDPSAEQVHPECNKACKDSREALLAIITFHHPDNLERARAERADLLAVLC